MRGLIAFALLLGSIFYTAPLNAQTSTDEDTWHVMALDRVDNSLYDITIDGMTEIALPTAPTSIAASVDGQYVVFMDADYTISVLNVRKETCCETFVNPYAADVDTLLRLGVGAINMDGSRVALYTLSPPEDEFAEPFRPQGEVVIITADGTIESTLPMTALDFEGNMPMPMFGDWLEDGSLEIYPTCYACDSASSGNYSIWNPAWGGGMGLNGVSVDGDYLALTGERLIRARDENFELQPELMLGPFNVLQYMPTPEDTPQLIYVDPATAVPNSRWIWDGQAVILHELTDDEVQIITRDGGLFNFAYEAETRFLGGTPDGWLAIETESGLVHHYGFNDAGEIEDTPLSAVAHTAWNEMSALHSPRLGTALLEVEYSFAPTDTVPN